MSFLIRSNVVSHALSRLRAQRTHALFAGYLHLQQKAGQLKRLTNLQPKFLQFFDQYYRVANHPVGSPYVRPFTDDRPSPKNLWLNENVAGSYAPSSIRPGQPFSKVVSVGSGRTYSLSKDHSLLAFENLLHGQKIQAAELATFLYRDVVLKGNTPSIDDLIGFFAVDFGYARDAHGPRNQDFHNLFSLDSVGDWPSDWFEHQETLIDSAQDDSFQHESETGESFVIAKRTPPLSAEDLLPSSRRQKTYAAPASGILSLKVKGLLSFGEQNVFKFGRLNILVGPNGSGKSNLIDCIRIFRASPTDIQQAFKDGGFESWLYNGSDKNTGSASVEIITQSSEGAAPIRHELRIVSASRARAQFEEIITDADSNEETVPYFVGSYRSQAIIRTTAKRQSEKEMEEYNPYSSILSQIRDIRQYPEITHLANLYSSIRIYSEWSFGRASKLREAASAGRSDSRLAENMADLPVALNALEETVAHDKIKKLLPELKASYRDYVTRLMFGRIGLELTETPFRTPVPASRLSDGTLRFLALAAILLQPDPPPVICIEEPELGMHPDMIRMVSGMLIDASKKAQIVISTHSEDLLTALQSDFDVLFAFDPVPNGTSVQRLSKEDFVKWRADHALGELWGSGELGGVRY